MSIDAPYVIDAEAHCDGPCGVYDPASARIAGEAVQSMTKKMLTTEAHLDFAAAIEAEAQAQAICMQHPDFREAYDAWVEKRDPAFE